MANKSMQCVFVDFCSKRIRQVTSVRSVRKGKVGGREDGETDEKETGSKGETGPRRGQGNVKYERHRL